MTLEAEEFYKKDSMFLIFRLAPKGELGLRPESRPKQSGGDEKLRKQKAKQSAPLADSTGRTVEVIELIVYFARVGTVVV